jgi:hypothetical protein
LLALLYGFGLRGLDVVLEYVVLRMTFMKPGGAVELSIVGGSIVSWCYNMAKFTVCLLCFWFRVSVFVA